MGDRVLPDTVTDRMRLTSAIIIIRLPLHSGFRSHRDKFPCKTQKLNGYVAVFKVITDFETKTIYKQIHL